MAQSNNLLLFDVNENVAEPVSNGNELCFASAESGILNVSNEISNRSSQQLEDFSDIESSCRNTLSKILTSTANLNDLRNNSNGDATSEFPGNESSVATTSATGDCSSPNFLDESVTEQPMSSTALSNRVSETESFAEVKDPVLEQPISSIALSNRVSETEGFPEVKDAPLQDCSKYYTPEKMLRAEGNKNSPSPGNFANCPEANGQSNDMKPENDSGSDYCAGNRETNCPSAQTSCQDLVDEYLPSSSLQHHSGQNLLGDTFSSFELKNMLQAPAGYNLLSESFASHEDSVCNQATNSSLLKSGSIDFCNETMDISYVPLQNTAGSTDGVFGDLSVKPEERTDSLGMSDCDKSVGATGFIPLQNTASSSDVVFRNPSVKPEERTNGLGMSDCDKSVGATGCSVPAGVLEDHPFKMPPSVANDEEEFTDAVQFFKDPSSLQFLESIKTSVPSESMMPRSSLYTAFDPLHAKFPPDQQSNPGVILESLESVDAPPVSNETDDSKEAPVNKQVYDLSVRESMGNILLSFDSPQVGDKAEVGKPGVPSPPVPRLYSEDELQQALKVNELTIQEIYLKQHREVEDEMRKVALEKDASIAKLSNLCQVQRLTIEELAAVAECISVKNKEMSGKVETLDEENERLKEEIKTADVDLQSVETTFADFHKRYEVSKGMLKTYKTNEAVFKEEIQNLKLKLEEQTQMYSALEERTQEILEKANAEVASVKKSNDAQVAVLKAQLKKAELKISSLESDIKQMRIENSKLGGICDDLMAKVRET